MNRNRLIAVMVVPVGICLMAAKCEPRSATASAGSAGDGAVKSICDWDLPRSKPTGALGLDRHETSNAYAVLNQAAKRKLPRRAAVIGIATTLQESQLRSDGPAGDGGLAIGVFQQHPSWGNDRRNASASANRFFSRLSKVSGWRTMSLTRAAQAVQKSGFPYAYAKHEARAEKIVNILTWRACKGR